MTTQQEQLYREAIRDFFISRTPFSGKALMPPTKLGVDLAMQWLALEGREKTIEILRNRIAVIVANRSAVGEKLSWKEADVLCAQALPLYLSLMTGPGLDWEKRDEETLSYLTDLYWQLPDRIVEEREEKTNCTPYLVSEPCMLASKKVVLSWVVGCWNLEPSRQQLELEKKNSAAAFGFICDIFRQERSRQKTSRENIAVIKSYLRGEGKEDSIMDESRKLLEEDEKLILKILREHCAPAKLDDIRPWVRDDLPDEMLKLFQDVLIRTSERKTVLKLLQGESAAV